MGDTRRGLDPDRRRAAGESDAPIERWLAGVPAQTPARVPPGRIDEDGVSGTDRDIADIGGERRDLPRRDDPPGVMTGEEEVNGVEVDRADRAIPGEGGEGN